VVTACLYYDEIDKYYVVAEDISVVCFNAVELYSRAIATCMVGPVSTGPLLRQQPYFCQYSWIRRCAQQTSIRPCGHYWQRRDWWMQIVWKRRFLVFKAQRAHPDNPKIKVKNFFHASCGIIGTTHLYAAAFSNVTILLQPDHFKSHGYSPVQWYSTAKRNLHKFFSDCFG